MAVSPRLLSDAVRRTLDLDGIHTVDVDGMDAQSDSVADVAVVSAGRASEVHARTVITLTGDASTVEPAHGVHVKDLPALRAALASALPRQGG